MAGGKIIIRPGCKRKFACLVGLGEHTKYRIFLSSLSKPEESFMFFTSLCMFYFKGELEEARAQIKRRIDAETDLQSQLSDAKQSAKDQTDHASALKGIV